MTIKSSTKHKTGMAIATLMLLAFSWLSNLAASAQGDLKPMAPQVDPNADAGKRAASAKPLQATIRQNVHPKVNHPSPMKAGAGKSNILGKLRGGAKTATMDALNGRNSDSGFGLQATSSVGIIGVKFALTANHPPVINRVFPGTPAAKEGLLPDDQIVAVDGVPTYGLSKEEIYDLIIGSPGTPVSVSIMRGSDYRVVSCIRMDINELTDPRVRRDYLLSM